MTAYQNVCEKLRRKPRKWLITGVAGFIGSHLLEKLLGLDQRVVGLDNLATGSRRNLEEVAARVTPSQWRRFRFIRGDIGDLATCRRACRGVNYVLHQAGLGSVVRSLRDPLSSHHSNVTGFLNMLVASRDRRVKRLVYASSSSVYGDEPSLPKREDRIGAPLSPYAATKRVDELYAGVFSRCYGVETMGLRYFNVFGVRQDPNGPYAAVIPKWMTALSDGKQVEIYGDGQTSRDFCYVSNVVQANLLAAMVVNRRAVNQVYNIATGERTTLDQLFYGLRERLAASNASLGNRHPRYRGFRPGDIRHSLADIRKARRLLGYVPTHNLKSGLAEMFAAP